MATSPRSLRVGVLLNDQLVEERLFDGATPITFGQSLRCTLSVPVDGVPREHVLFTKGADGHFELHETSRMQVKRVERRGRIAVGEATILFQEVSTPPPAPRPQLPASIRGTFSDRIDRRLATIIGGSLMVHLALAVWAWTSDVPTTPLGFSQPLAYHQDVIDVIVPDDLVAPPAPTTEPAPGVAAPVKPTQTAKPIVRPTNIQKPATGDDAQRLAAILTGDTGSETGRGGMSPRQPGVDLGKQIDDARNHKITIGDGTHTSRTEDPRPGTVPDRPIVDDPSLTRNTHRNEETPKGRIQIGPIKDDDRTTLTPALVLEWINTRYMVGLQRCYKEGLKLDSTLSGKIGVGFTVDDRGQVIDQSASGVSTDVDGCVKRLMGNWRFPIPKDKDGDPTDASFTVSLALRPS